MAGGVVMRFIDWLADDLGLAPRDVITAFLALPVAIVVAAGVWFLVAMLVVAG